MRIIDSRTIETECDSCACTFTTGRGEDGEPDDILCSECKRTWQELRAELAREYEQVWWETFTHFPFKALPAPAWVHTGRSDCQCSLCIGLRTPAIRETVAEMVLADLDWAYKEAAELDAWRESQDLMDAADQAAYYSPRWEENQ